MVRETFKKLPNGKTKERRRCRRDIRGGIFFDSSFVCVFKWEKFPVYVGGKINPLEILYNQFQLLPLGITPLESLSQSLLLAVS